jgi:Uma2 family endonuclease
MQDVSYDTFLSFVNEDIACELIDGMLVIHSPASYKHESIFSFLNAILKIFGSRHGLGTPIGSRFIMKLSNSWVPEPDIMFLTPEDQQRLRENFLDGPASVVFEILSKSTRQDDMNKKLPAYLEMGVKEVWIIDPENKSIHVHWAGDSFEARGDDKAESRFIDDFWLLGPWLWNSESMPVEKVIAEIENRSL